MELKINKQTARKLYHESPGWFKEQLTGTFGSEISIKLDFEEIRSFEDACKKLKLNPEDIINDTDLPDETAYKKLKVIVKAINNGWIPNWTDINQKKWYPYFVLSSGFGFSASDYYYVSTFASVGSRLCFESQEKADYAGNTFVELYKDLLIIN